MDLENQTSVENQRLRDNDTKPHERPYFWTRNKVYCDEICIPKSTIPLWRTLNTAVVFYTFYVGIDFAASLCK
jgi:hypothetical protein